MPALSYFRVKRRLFRFGLAPSGKVPGLALLAAFSRYIDLPRSLFSHYLLRLSFTSPNGPPRSFSCCKGL